MTSFSNGVRQRQKKEGFLMTINLKNKKEGSLFVDSKRMAFKDKVKKMRRCCCRHNN
jgi:hypothetical protein